MVTLRPDNTAAVAMYTVFRNVTDTCGCLSFALLLTRARGASGVFTQVFRINSTVFTYTLIIRSHWPSLGHLGRADPGVFAPMQRRASGMLDGPLFTHPPLYRDLTTLQRRRRRGGMEWGSIGTEVRVEGAGAVIGKQLRREKSLARLRLMRERRRAKAKAAARGRGEGGQRRRRGGCGGSGGHGVAAATAVARESMARRRRKRADRAKPHGRRRRRRHRRRRRRRRRQRRRRRLGRWWRWMQSRRRPWRRRSPSRSAASPPSHALRFCFQPQTADLPPHAPARRRTPPHTAPVLGTPVPPRTARPALRLRRAAFGAGRRRRAAGGYRRRTSKAASTELATAARNRRRRRFPRSESARPLSARVQDRLAGASGRFACGEAAGEGGGTPGER